MGARHLASAVVLVLASAACSGGPAEPPATAPAGGSSTAAEPTAPPPGPVDPCSLLTPDDLEDAGLDADPDGAIRALDPDPRTTACLVPHAEEGWAVFYGFSLRRGVSAAEAAHQLGTERPVRLEVGDRARMALYSAYGDRIWHAWANQGPYAVMVKLFAKPRRAQVEQLLDRLLDGVEPAMFRFPIDLPEDCPGPRSRPITGLMGPVATATGSEGEGGLRCAYATRRGRMLELRTSPMRDAVEVNRTVGRVAKYFDEPPSAPARGVTLYVAAADYYPTSHAYLTRPPSSRSAALSQATPISAYFRPLVYDEQRFRRVARWWSLAPSG